MQQGMKNKLPSIQFFTHHGKLCTTHTQAFKSVDVSHASVIERTLGLSMWY